MKNIGQNQSFIKIIEFRWSTIKSYKQWRHIQLTTHTQQINWFKRDNGQQQQESIKFRSHTAARSIVAQLIIKQQQRQQVMFCIQKTDSCWLSCNCLVCPCGEFFENKIDQEGQSPLLNLFKIKSIVIAMPNRFDKHKSQVQILTTFSLLCEPLRNAVED